MKGWKKLYHASTNQKKNDDKLDLKTRSIIKDNKGHFIIIKGLIHQEFKLN